MAAAERRLGLRQGRRGVGAMAIGVREGWRRGDLWLRAGLAGAGLAGAALSGASIFGLVHVVGGAWHGNPRALGFGVGLTTASMWLLAGLARIARVLVDRRSG